MKASKLETVRNIGRIRTLLVTLSVAVCLATLMGCGNKPEKDTSPAADDIETLREAAAPAVTGTIRGTQVKMTGAKLDRQLFIFEGRSWGFNPSLVIFFSGKFTGDPAGRTMEVKADAAETGRWAQVHYRWKNPDTDKLDVKIVMEEYDLKIVFGQPKDGFLPGTIAFSIPGEKTKVSGSFRAKLENFVRKAAEKPKPKQAEAATRTRQAAEQGDPDAQYSLGNIYYYGQGVPKDDAEAVKWYRKAAEQGYASAQYRLGVSYNIGHGVPMDKVTAYAWFSVAAASGDDDARMGRDVVKGRLTPSQLEKGEVMAREISERMEKRRAAKAE